MKRVVKLAGISIFCAMPLLSVYAEDLSSVYKEALASDPTYKKAEADWLTAKESLPLAMTGNGAPGSGLFPNISAAGTLGRTYYPENPVNYHVQSQTYAISITQPIFNLVTWESIGSARYSVKAAMAKYLAANQDLMRRTAVAYFEVLRANEKLTLTLAQKKQFLHEYETAKSKYQVGLIAITPLYDAEAKYDQAVAQEIKDRNTLQNMLENLDAITGKEYSSLLGLNEKIPLLMPEPQRMAQWVSIAEKQNYLIQFDLNSMYASKKNIGVAAAAKVPTLNFVGSYQDGSVSVSGFNGQPAPNVGQAQVGLNLSFPILRGGYDIVNTRRARYQYLAASDQLEIDHRQVVTETQKAFLGVTSGMSQIHADQQAIISAKNQLDATQEGFGVGTRTMVDVLNSMTSLTSVQQQYADDRYNYLESILNLKEQAGTLSFEDLDKMNTWLGKRIIFSLQQPDIKVKIRKSEIFTSSKNRLNSKDIS